MVEGNYFFGNRKPNTGGIRIINETQTVKNNYLEGLTGYRLRGALVIMNGVPNSPINRYSPVKDSEASGNLFIDCDYIQLCAGNDEERSAVPTNTKMTNNIFYNTKKDDLFTVYDDISGITFADNLLSPNVIFPTNKGKTLTTGFTHQTIQFEEINGLKQPKGIHNIGPDIRKERPSAENTGVSWYPRKDYTIQFNTGKTITVEEGENTIFNAVKKSSSGDILVLKANGKYYQSKAIDIHHSITIKSESNTKKPVLTFGRTSLFNLENGGTLYLQGLHISGKESDDYAGNNLIRTSKYSMTHNYKLIMKDCEVTDLDVNHSFNVLRVYKNTFADSIVLENCKFDNISGHVLELNKETDDIGVYNAENVLITNCKFNKIGGSVVDLYRGGSDESTFGPMLEVSACGFANVGQSSRNKSMASIKIHGVQYANFKNNSFENSKAVDMYLTVGDPVIIFENTKFINCEEIRSNSDKYTIK
jgi:poly(beta-D-mannuronate) lyase